MLGSPVLKALGGRQSKKLEVPEGGGGFRLPAINGGAEFREKRKVD